MPSLQSKKIIPLMTLGLALSLLLWSLVLVAAGAVKPGWSLLDLTVVRFWGVLLALGLLATLVTALLQRSRGQLCLCLAGFLLLTTATYSYLFHFEGALSLAEGESYEPFPTSFSSGHKGGLAPFPQVSFTLTRVEPDGKKGRAVIVQKGVGTEIDTNWRALGSSEVRFKGSALAPLIVVSSKEKGELERSYVKVDLAQGEQVFGFDTLPYQFLLSRDKSNGEGKDLFHLAVRRGKLGLYDGSVRLGQKVAVQGMEVSIEDQRKFALLEIRTRRGVVAMQAAAVLFAVVAVLAVVRRKAI
ncbi:hypothetical protein KP004_16795 [Geomonas oryzisoli]|uniref:ResB-like domain-containing protein n=1 Tax=Geomonas oryzisoli TaxID=2847992 RepID=A0ABX8J4S3_9BACT|nr:hypothetical protein [Geomonas oryzisoli]QWV92818.1 hypothetical protein KP004_16795 [Geomonas oryzisoli]